MGRWKVWKDIRVRRPAKFLIAVFLMIILFIGLTLSLSGKIGQAEDSLSTLLMSKLSVRVMDASSSLIRYQAKDKKREDLLMTMLTKEFPAYEFTEEKQSLYDLLHSPVPVQKLEASMRVWDDVQSETASKQGMEQEQTGGLAFHDISQGMLTREYLLTNGAAFDQKSFLDLLADREKAIDSGDGQLAVGIIEGQIFADEGADIIHDGQGADMEVMRSNIGTAFTMEDLKDINFLIRNFYIVDPDTSITDELFHSDKLLGKDMTIKQKNDQPQILIYHTHSREAYADSREGVAADTVVGMGAYLTQILEERYGYNVIHDTTAYDTMSQGDANLAYNYAYNGISKILEENPTIEVVIDIHRDGVDKRSTILEGKETAQIMLFNGLSRSKKGPRTNLDNPYLQDNLAFSFQLQLKALEKYPGLFYRNYLKGYRYNLHLRPKSILIELGTYKNTVASAKNAIEPFAEVLDEVLQGP